MQREGGGWARGPEIKDGPYRSCELAIPLAFYLHVLANSPERMIGDTMPINLLVAITDSDWFESLRKRPDLDEVNFWAPSGSSFKALDPGELFLFKLHSPRNFIVGGGTFAYSTILPSSLVWASFGEKNGASSLAEMRVRISKYRRATPNERTDFEVGCRVLTQPFFWPESQWIPVPESWSKNIVTFKRYSTDDPDGRRLWEAVQNDSPIRTGFAEEQARYGEPTLIRPRLGQGAFRLLVTDKYSRRCAVTEERTLPALDAAHIKPFAEGGSHDASNGILLRKDVHSLFDANYATVSPDLRFEVSKRIKEEFENGRHYYALHGKQVAVPFEHEFQPDREAIEWHNSRFLG